MVDQNDDDQIVLGVNVTQFHKPDLTDIQTLNHKNIFEEWLKEKFNSKKTYCVMTYAEIEVIKDILKGHKKIDDPSKRFQFKKKKYSLNENGEVCRTMELPGSAKGFFVTYIECFYEKIYEVHCSKRGHQGILSNI